VTRLHCPACRSAELATIEHLTGVCSSSFERDSDGALTVQGQGSTEVAWDSSRVPGDAEVARWASAIERDPAA